MKWRLLFHCLILLPPWLLFFWGWYLILSTWPRAELMASLRLLALVGAVCAVAITLWIRHNLGIFRRKGPRLHPRLIHASFAHDALGRPVVTLQPDVLHNSWIHLDVKDGAKIYSSGASRRPDHDAVLKPVGPE